MLEKIHLHKSIPINIYNLFIFNYLTESLNSLQLGLIANAGIKREIR